MGTKRVFIQATDLLIDEETGALCVTIDDGGVSTAMLADKAVTAVKLADAAAAEILTVTGEAVDREDGTAHIDLTVRNSRGVGTFSELLVWVSNDPMGGPVAATDLGVDTGTAGLLLKEHTPNALLSVLTHRISPVGVVRIMLTDDDGTYYLFASCNGRVVVTEVTITGN